MKADMIYSALCGTCDVLENISCKYYLAGGTLLGARRDGDIIKHDVDFDLDCFVEDEDKILQAQHMFSARGLRVKRKLIGSARSFETLEPPSAPKYSSCLTVEYQGQHIGDISIYTLFDDGIARRFDLEEGTYSNPKMSLPCWYYTGDCHLEIRGRRFRSVREPELVIEKIYGPDWRVPAKPGEFANGRHEQSGSVPDADIESLMIFARERGWRISHQRRPVWPQEIRWVGWPAEEGWEWIWRHEPMIRPELAAWIMKEASCSYENDDLNNAEIFQRRILAARAIQSEVKRSRIEDVKVKPVLTLPRRIYRTIPLPPSLREKLRSVYRNARGR